MFLFFQREFLASKLCLLFLSPSPTKSFSFLWHYLYHWNSEILPLNHTWNRWQVLGETILCIRLILFDWCTPTDVCVSRCICVYICMHKCMCMDLHVCVIKFQWYHPRHRGMYTHTSTHMSTELHFSTHTHTLTCTYKKPQNNRLYFLF